MSQQVVRDNEFLLPAHGGFIFGSLLLALILNWLPWSGWALLLRPDFVALTLLYWCTHKPHRVNIGTAWLLGILSDVADANLLGQHAIAYSLLAFGGTVLNRRIQMLDLQQQTLQVLPLLLACYGMYFFVQWLIRGHLDPGYFLGCITSSLLWVPLTLLLQALRQVRTHADQL